MDKVSKPEINTANSFLVHERGEGIALMNPPLIPISKEQALNLAAWLVVIVGDDDRFEETKAAIENI